ncbi:hypothetical protein [Enterococcus italicus]|uniref:hypothetical protein n=1 Tax=Enterococcus italicus TaxID=246144 RepID=UPI002073C24D|nr:hypothetical protein [Enterococcus italicus]
MNTAKEIELSVQQVLDTMRASSYLCDSYGNKIEQVTAIGESLLKIEFANNQKTLIEHVSQFRCFIAK